MRTSTKAESDPNKSLHTLYERHIAFHKFLDRLAAKANDNAEIELIINLRQFNLDCMNKYSDLIVKRDIVLDKLAPQNRYPFNGGLEETNMTLWNIHGQLMRFIPVYTSALRDVTMNRVAKSIVSHNYDRLIRLKDDLLHPVNELQLN